jgi:hypothetical protein
MGERGGVNLYGYVGNNPISFTDPLGLAKYFGGSREGTGHFWTAVDLPNGHVMRYDFSAGNYNGPTGGSSGSAGDLFRTLHTSGKVELREFDTIDKAAGPNEHYRFEETPERDAEMLARMQRDQATPPDYGVLTANCGGRACQVGGFDSLADISIRPAGFLNDVKDVWEKVYGKNKKPCK